MSPVVHFEMPASDLKRVKAFYEEVFGWNMQQLGAEMSNYLLAGTVAVGENGMPKEPGAINGGFYEKTKESPEPSVVISVDDLNEGIERVKKAGGKILGETMNIPGIGMFASFRDTEGNRVGMLQPVPMS